MVQTVTYVSTAISLAMCAYMAWLIFRRWQAERMAGRMSAMQREITRHYLSRVNESAQPEVSASQDPAWSPALQLQAASHLLQLLRGDERQRLLHIADEEGLIEPALARAKSRRTTARRGAIRILEHFGSRRCLSALVGLMANDPAPAVRLEAAGALARLDQLPSLRDTISLLDLHTASPTQLHKAILRSMAPRNPAELTELLDTVIPAHLRMLLVDAVGSSGQLSVLDKLIEAGRHEDPGVRVAALLAAAQLGHAGKGEWVLALLGDGDPSVRASAAQVCGTLGLRHAIEPLRDLNEDCSSWVRMQADIALARLAPARSGQEAA